MASGFLKKTLNAGSGTIIAQAISFFTMPLLARLYSPEQYGQLGVYLAVTGVLAGALTFRFELGVLNASDETESGHFADKAAWLNRFGSTLVGLTTWLSPYPEMAFFNHPKWLSGVLLALFCYLTNLQLIRRYRFLRSHRSSALFLAAPSQVVTRSLSQYIAGVFLAPWGLIVGELLSRFPPIFLFGNRRHQQATKLAPKPTVTEFIRTHSTYPKYLLPSYVVDTLAQSLPVPYLARNYGLEAAGIFVMQQRLWQLPIQVVSDGLSDVFHLGLSSAASRSSAKELKNTFFRTLFILIGIAFSIVLALGFGAERLVPWFLGSKWEAAGHMVSDTAPWYLAALVISPLSRVLLVTKSMKVKMSYDILTLILLILTVVWQGLHGSDLRELIKSVSWVYFLTYLFYFGIILKELFKKLVSMEAK